jgi:putative (di)nucleoside polyphosphate hydrolase
MGLYIAGGEVLAAQLPLRPCAGIILFNREGRVWIGRRRRPKWASYAQPDIDDYIWQPPQGGIDKGETARVAAFRELREETGVINATLISELPDWLSYELPSDLLGVALKGKYAGQRLRWFAMRFKGRESEIDLAPKGGVKSEFDSWRWANLEELPDLALPFKRPVYEAVVRAFAPLLAGGTVA